MHRFSGQNCEVNLDDCADGPCKNGGMCVDGDNTFTCSCTPFWVGDTCEINIDECKSLPCLNGGNCIDYTDSLTIGYVCDCSETGFHGQYCEDNRDECLLFAANPCQNGGTCIDQLNDYSCACVRGYSGKNCEVNIDECKPNPCKNAGTCHDGVGIFTCVCNKYWTGATCENEVDSCSLPNGESYCLHGSCGNTVGGRFCHCPGYTGSSPRCCVPSPFALLDAKLPTFFCLSAALFPPHIPGDRCETEVNECESTPCQSGGICQDGINSFTCICSSYWDGPTCQDPVNACFFDDAASFCQNGGTCVYQPGARSCSCIAGYTGLRCEINIQVQQEGGAIEKEKANKRVFRGRGRDD